MELELVDREVSPLEISGYEEEKEEEEEKEASSEEDDVE
ncbi:hypothetical protein OROGR_005474 [Orobanche gracilis]